MAKRTNSELHEVMVVYIAQALSNAGYRDIKTVYPEDDNQPEKIIWGKEELSYVPDVTAVKNGVKHIIEIETGELLINKHSMDHWAVFSQSARKTNASFSVVLPAEYKNKAKHQMARLGIAGYTNIIKLSMKPE